MRLIIKLKKIKYSFIFLSCLIGILFCSTLSVLSGNPLREITVLLEWVPNTNHTGMYVALERGFMKRKDYW